MTQKIRIYLAQLNPTVGDVLGNINLLCLARERATKVKAEIILAPEMFISGYSVDDLVFRLEFTKSIESEISKLAKITNDGGPAIIVGAPRNDNGILHNSVFILDKGKILGFRDKAKLANEDEFYENRQFVPGDFPGPIFLRGLRIGLPICEDLWDPEVCECLIEAGAELILSINGSTYNTAKMDQRINTIVSRVIENEIPIVYLNMVGGQDELLFDGGSFAINRDGKLACQLPMFCSYESYIDVENNQNGWSILTSEKHKYPKGIASLYGAIILSIKDYVEKNGFSSVVLGLSGGIDSALVATMSVDALGHENVKTFMMPSEFTSETSFVDAKEISENLSISFENLSIKEIYKTITTVLDPIFGLMGKDVTEENIQSRVRSLLLMGISNKYGNMLLSTSNKSESAVGYSTLYGDMSGGFAPLKDVWKTDVFALSKWRNNNLPNFSKYSKTNIIPENIISKAPTAELRYNQKDTDSLPDYSVLDKILSMSIEEMKSPAEIIENGYDAEEVKHVLKLLKASEYKRFQSPPGPKVGLKAFGRDRMYPLTNKFN